jgi:predicted metalloprotease with PDZ domain
MKPDLIRFTACLFIAFLLLGECSAQTESGHEYTISIDLLNVSPDKDRVKITIIPPEVKSQVVYFTFPEYLPGVSGKVDAGRFVHQFYALDDQGFPLKVKKKGENVIMMKMRKGATLKKIEYWVDDTWDMEKSKPNLKDDKFNYVPQAAGTNFESNISYVLNMGFLVGYIQGFETAKYNLTIIKAPELAAATAFHVQEKTRTHDQYRADSYSELIDKPILYAQPDTLSAEFGNLTVRFGVFSENGKISARMVRRLIAVQLSSYSQLIDPVQPTVFTMLFYFTTPFRTVLNMNGDYDGLGHHTSVFYFLPELADEDALANELQRQTATDIFHLFGPLDYRISAAKTDYEKPFYSKAWWFCEGAAQYFSWVSMVRDSVVSEEEFRSALSQKIRLSQQAYGEPLTNLNFINELNRDPLQREALRARAMLTVFMLDIYTTELCKRKKTLSDAMRNISRCPAFVPDSIQSYFEIETGQDFGEFFNNYVYGNSPLPLMDYLGRIGWAYAPEAIDSVYTFGKFGLAYDENLDAYFVHNAEPANLFGLRNGDRIVSVDNILVNAMSFEDAFDPIYSAMQQERVDVRYIRNGINYTSFAFPLSFAQRVEFLIRPDAAACRDAILLHHRLLTYDY